MYSMAFVTSLTVNVGKYFFTVVTISSSDCVFVTTSFCSSFSSISKSFLMAMSLRSLYMTAWKVSRRENLALAVQSKKDLLVAISSNSNIRLQPSMIHSIITWITGVCSPLRCMRRIWPPLFKNLYSR